MMDHRPAKGMLSHFAKFLSGRVPLGRGAVLSLV